MKTNKLLIPILCLCAITAWAQDYFYAYYSDGTFQKFKTEKIDSVSLVPPTLPVDACGNEYPIVVIGNQVWMAENMFDIRSLFPTTLISRLFEALVLSR